jgi:anti-sigma factor RsiW
MGMNTDCDQLDPYLLELLDSAERAAFEAHLAGCPACRRDLAVQRNLDRLLARAGQEDSGPAPPVALRFEQRLRARRRRIWRGAGALAAGLLVAAAGLRWAGTARRANEPLVATDRGPAVSPATTRPQVSVQLSADLIGVPIETRDPRVTIVWTYPVVRLADKK